MYTLKFMDDKPCIVTLGHRGIPANGTPVQHPDGTTIYLVPQDTHKHANEMIVLQSKFDASAKTAKYLQYGYIEYILDVSDPDMFLLVMEEFGDWHNQLQY